MPILNPPAASLPVPQSALRTCSPKPLGKYGPSVVESRSRSRSQCKSNSASGSRVKVEDLHHDHHLRKGQGLSSLPLSSLSGNMSSVIQRKADVP
ncbi:hypothetical protein Cob_v012016 [Colletotrichum orbiculare MAFF 240422]|uniref:Uncharacterized protein n=1 Tax=Colletotrichum orbiculare (strain 104-T / ATCC 96160 / CBS 514.97 / LARS 414 / MAFF 240422) TaxID=1213857 RepID=A0A484FB60_COLOR|nr:hypothetical protein Cob_v012016 [Colletotrichum orbiculare MAFF 240422]